MRYPLRSRHIHRPHDERNTERIEVSSLIATDCFGHEPAIVLLPCAGDLATAGRPVRHRYRAILPSQTWKGIEVEDPDRAEDTAVKRLLLSIALVMLLALALIVLGFVTGEVEYSTEYVIYLSIAFGSGGALGYGFVALVVLWAKSRAKQTETRKSSLLRALPWILGASAGLGAILSSNLSGARELVVLAGIAGFLGGLAIAFTRGWLAHPPDRRTFENRRYWRTGQASSRRAIGKSHTMPVPPGLLFGRTASSRCSSIWPGTPSCLGCPTWRWSSG